jgi:hypothetical protein
MIGNTAWIVQLHKGVSLTFRRTIYPGNPEKYHVLDVEKGIDGLRNLIEKVEGTGDGIIIQGNVGVTSHFGDLLRRARIPSKIRFHT